MNGWMIAFCVWYAYAYGAALATWAYNGGTLEVRWYNLFIGPGITLGLLYMGGAFS
jgi:hypothetical protein